MIIPEIMKELYAADVKIWIEDDQLCINTSKEALSEELLIRLKEKKQDIMAFLRQAMMVASVPHFTKNIPIHRPEILPLSFAQQRLWFLDQLEPGGSVYGIHLALRIKGEVDLWALEQSLNEIVRRHEALRTTFESREGQGVQVIVPRWQGKLHIIDLAGWEGDRHEEEVKRLAEEEARRPFNLETGPLFRTRLLILGDEAYVLIINMHHIVSDGWSIQIFKKEMRTLYEAYEKGESPLLAELPIQYADFAVWQREWLQGSELQRQLSYWTDKLKDIPAALELPADHPRPPIQSYRGAEEEFTFSREIQEGLERLSQKQGVTLFMVLLTAFKIWLYRYTSQSDIVVGTPIAGRNRAEIEDLIGFFVNTLVLRTGLGGHPTFNELLVRVKETALGAYAHQDLPFEKLVDELQPKRDLSRSPLFQVMFVMHNMPGVDFGLLPGTEIVPFEFRRSTSKFDLTLFMASDAQGLQGCIEYSTDLFERETILRMIGHFKTLVNGILADPEQTIDGLPFLSKEEERRILEEWNDTGADYPSEKCIHGLFEEQVQRTPDAIALVFEDGCLSCDALNRRANQLAHYVRGLGVGPECLVGICLDRSLEMVIALLGMLKAGGAYVPLDPSYPEERLSFMLKDAGAQILITHSSLSAIFNFSSSAPTIILLDREESILNEQPEHDPKVVMQSGNLAYVIYTSGSTGQPKGVQIPHQALVNFLNAMLNELQWSAEERLLSVTSISFDIAGLELYLLLMSGAGLTIIERQAATDGEQLYRCLKSCAITVMQATPATWRLLLEAGWPGAKGFKVLCGGEALPPGLAVQLLERGVELWNLYGPTETTIWSTSNRLMPGGTLSIGRPIDNTRIYVLDSLGQAVPLGVPGELYIGGEGLARGYLNRPDLTAEKFTPDPYSDEPGARIYRTGDRVRYFMDGSIGFLGRVDTQVKIRGYRIELGEIESVLSKHPQVRENAVIIQNETGSNQRLVGYFVAKDGNTISTHSLQSFLKKQLPDYMIPSVFVMLDKLPVSPNGKVNRKALPAPEGQGLRSEEVVPPHTPFEKKIIVIWKEVLNIDSVGIYDNFFELGGHSLLATRVVSRLRQIFGIELSIRSLFEEQTISGLAKRIEVTLKGEERVSVPSIKSVNRDKSLELSFAQQRLWFLDQLEPGGSVYNIRMVLRIKGEVDLRALEQSLKEIVRRHEALRTTFESREGQGVQVIAPRWQGKLHIVDLAGWEGDKREEEAKRLVEEEAQRPFDLGRGPLLRASLWIVRDAEYVLVLNMHHIVSDGWSTQIFKKEMRTLYEAYVKGESPLLAELPIQYADFAVWQREWLQGSELQRQLSYWTDKLKDIPAALELPADHPRLSIQSYRGSVAGFTLPAGTLQKLEYLSQKQGATLFMVLLAIFKIMLYRYTFQEDLVVGTPIAGRNHAEIESLIGFFLNTLVLRTDLSGNPSFRKLLHRVKETALEAYAHQDLPFEKLVDVLQPERDMSRSPLFQVMFVLQNTPETKLELPGAKITSFDFDRTSSNYDLSIYMTVNDRELSGWVEYSTDLFENEFILRMIGHFDTLIKSVITDPNQAINRLSILTPEEERRILIEWNDTPKKYPDNKCLHTLFEEQVNRTPEALALIFEDQALTYDQLNRRANQLAHRLRSLNIGSDILVGICIERSLEMVIGLLGILKTGGAYVPLDPTYPMERLDFMLEDSKVQVLLTQSSLAPSFTSCPLSKIICLDTEFQRIAEERMDNPMIATPSDSLAYTLYTSGSTGRPKGVQISHKALVNLLHSMKDKTEWSPKDRLLSVTSLSFDIVGLELYLPLMTGAVLKVVDRLTAADGEALRRCLEQDGITAMQATPITWRLLLAAGWSGSQEFKALCGGEAMPPDLAAQLLTKGCKVWNLYGPTETTIWSTSNRLIPGKSLSIGRPIDNTRIYILDSLQQAVPIGVPGELYIGGEGLARGYLKRPDLTAEKFMPDPFGGVPNARMYRTGDLARYLHDGNIEFLGRIDSQVKIRGFRIELGEIEAVLRKHSNMNEVIVQIKDQQQDTGQVGSGEQKTTGDIRLVAYVVPKQMPGPCEEELQEFMKMKLPEYMIPSTFVMLEVVPRLPNGKINRRALPMPKMRTRELVRLADLPLQANVADWFYTPVWRQTPLPSEPSTSTTGHWLIFSDHGGLSKTLTRQLRENGRQVITVLAGKQYKVRKNAYFLRPGFREDYEALITELQKRDQRPQVIIHLWNVAPLSPKILTKPIKALQYSFYSLLFLAQALGRRKYDQNLRLIVVSSQAQRVIKEDTIQPAKAVLLGFCRVIPQELERMICRSIDVEESKDRFRQENWLADQIIAEAEGSSGTPIIAYRNFNRWVQTYDSWPLDQVFASGNSILREEGVYLIIDGSGSIGLNQARYLARTKHAKIILITNTSLLAPEMRPEYIKTHDRNDPGRLLIETIQEMESLGLPGLTMRAEVSNEDQMKAVVSTACECFGTIHGVIYCAGPVLGRRILSEDFPSAAKILELQLQEIQNLKTVLENRKLDFFFLCSPLTSLIGGLNRSVPCAGSALKTAFALSREMGRSTIYRAVYLDVEKVLDPGDPRGLDHQQDQIFQRLFSDNREAPMIISARHLPSLMEHTTQIARLQAMENDSNLLTGNAIASGSTEEKLALIWQELLGVRKITRNDSFFRVGGHSLVAIQLINRVRDTFKVDIPFRASFEAPTIAELAKRIEQKHKEAPRSSAATSESMLSEKQTQNGFGHKIAGLIRHIFKRRS